MEQYAGIDVSLDSASVCIVDAQGKILKEAKVASEPETLMAGWAKQERAKARPPRGWDNHKNAPLLALILA